ncbi:hypothetical protein [Salinifilum aidingensis]
MTSVADSGRRACGRLAEPQRPPEPLSRTRDGWSRKLDAHRAAYARQVGRVEGRSPDRPSTRAGVAPVTGMAIGGTP